MPCRAVPCRHLLSSHLLSSHCRRAVAGDGSLLMITTHRGTVAQARAAMWIGADAVTLGGSLNDPVKQVMP